MARRGRQRKSGAREPNGRLCRSRPAWDRGHELTLAHRAAVLAGADPRDPRASEPLGILYLRGELADPDLDADQAAEQGLARYTAGIKFARDHALVWNRHPDRPGRPRSQLGSFLPDRRGPGDYGTEDVDDQRRRERRLRSATARVYELGPYPLFVLEDVVVFQTRMAFMDQPRRPLFDTERSTIAALRSALATLVDEYR